MESYTMFCFRLEAALQPPAGCSTLMHGTAASILQHHGRDMQHQEAVNVAVRGKVSSDPSIYFRIARSAGCAKNESVHHTSLG